MPVGEMVMTRYCTLLLVTFGERVIIPWYNDKGEYESIELEAI